MSALVKRNLFHIVKNITWDDMIDKLNNECDSLTIQSYACNECPTMVCRNDYYPNTILDAYQEVDNKIPVSGLHIYTSFSSMFSPYGRHRDDEDVLIVQAVGNMTYSFDDGSVCKLEPGDALYIPEGVHHNPSVSGPRITLSFKPKPL